MDDTKVTIQKAMGMVLQLNYLLYGWIAEIENKTIDPSIEVALKEQIANAMLLMNEHLENLGVNVDAKETTETESA